MDEQVQQLIDAVKNAAPVMWQAAYRQVWIDGIENLLVAGTFAILALLLRKTAKYYASRDSWGNPSERQDWTEPGPILSMVGCGIATLLTLPFIVEAIDCFANPTFQAIKNLAGLRH